MCELRLDYSLSVLTVMPGIMENGINSALRNGTRRTKHFVFLLPFEEMYHSCHLYCSCHQMHLFCVHLLWSHPYTQVKHEFVFLSTLSLNSEPCDGLVDLSLISRIYK